MIHMELTLEDLDYDMLIDRFLPVIREKLQQNSNPIAMLLSNGMPAAMAKTILKQLPQDKKDQLAADLINQFSGKIGQAVEDAAVQHDIRVAVRDLQARSGS